MRPTFFGFETATRGLMASQKAIDIVGNNIANIGVTGYTRQRVDLVSMSINTSSSRYARNPVSLAGAGSMVSGISQIRDSYLDKRFRDEYADVGYFDTVTTILQDVETNLSEIEPSTITSALTSLENAWSEMQNEGGQSSVVASSILSASRTLTQVFTQISTKLGNLWQQQKTDLSTSTNTVNSLLEQIANYNKTIKNEVTVSYGGNLSTYGPNELLDQRNVLIDQLSRYADISVQNLSDGTVTITMGTDNHVAVKDTDYDALLLSNGGSDTTVELSWKSTGNDTGISSGILKGSLEMLNGRGISASPSAGESLENGILYYMDKIDAFASTLANAFNSFIPIVDSNGDLSGNYKQLFSFSGDGEATAANLTVNSDWLNDATYLITDIHPTGEGLDDTTFVTNALQLFSAKHDFGEFQGTFDSYIQFYTTSQLATEISYNKNCLESSSDIADSVLTSISEVSGVSMEEEGVDMTQWTKAFNAMSRVMTAMDEILDTLINRTGLVGRS
ncbi:flagellar hook-associated protein FlgK [Oscillospiraceae bacterium LTW-04]|nr:flagellar hook-associated protein FlgK [Oscillospiraceae bacterium MB24-C1]